MPEFRATLSPPELRGFAGNAVFFMLFLGSALLFRKTERIPNKADRSDFAGIVAKSLRLG
ncbi:MAG: hypothetical protein AB9869_09645 [Verrucomicrobiia bacterium]